MYQREETNSFAVDRECNGQTAKERNKLNERRGVSLIQFHFKTSKASGGQIKIIFHWQILPVRDVDVQESQDLKKVGA